MIWWILGTVAYGFCGTYVGPANDTPSNTASRLVVVHDQDRTVLTMTSDAPDAPENFGLLMPVPQGLDEDDIEVVADTTPLEELDAFTAPRLVSYTCASAGGNLGAQLTEGCSQSAEGCARQSAEELLWDAAGQIAGVDVLSLATKGIYQFAVIDAENLGALQRWLDLFGFQTAPGADKLIETYIDQGVNFMAARITMPGANDDPWLQPIRITYPTRTFDLPLKLGATNADGDQDVLLWVIGDQADGEAQVLSFPEVQQETDCMVQSGSSSRQTVNKAFSDARGDEPGVAVVEYSWDLSQKCDPCGAGGGDPTTFLTDLGKTDPANAYVTRLRLRFDPLELEQDLHFSYTNSVAQTQLVYIEHLDELEDTYPLCFEGFPANPKGTCAEDDDGAQGASVPWWTLLWFPLVGWGLRRKTHQ